MPQEVPQPWCRRRVSKASPTGAAATAQAGALWPNAHGDVVPPGEGWTHDPYGGRIEDGRSGGRAAAVSKCDFSGLHLCHPRTGVSGAFRPRWVDLIFTYDEEFMAKLPRSLLAPGPGTARFCLSLRALATKSSRRTTAGCL